MPKCYWKLCTCTDEEPCIEHFGILCGQWNGIQITKETDIVDVLTTLAETEFAKMEKGLQSSQI